MGFIRSLNFHYKEWIAFVICVLSVITGIIFYPMMPQLMASHWGINGAADGYMSAFWGSVLMPLVIVAMFLLFVFIPRADPLKKNIDLFKGHFLNFILILLLFMYALQVFEIAWNLNYKMDIIFVIVPLFAILFFYTGVMLSNAKQNMTIGIRTPWTLKSKKSWDMTHKRTGTLLKIISVVFLLGLVFRRQEFLILIVPLLLVFLYAFVYSYVVYEIEHKNNGMYNKENKMNKTPPKKH